MNQPLQSEHMNQRSTEANFRHATLNVGCLGMFQIRVYDDGFWEVELNYKDESTFTRTRGTMLPAGRMLNYSTMEYIEFPEWVWKCVEDKMEELKIMMKRNALSTPEIKNVVV